MSNHNPSGPFDFEQLRRLLEQLGLGGDQVDLEALLAQLQHQMQHGGLAFAMTNADQDPDAAWRTTLTAAKQLAAQNGAEPDLTEHERIELIDAERLAQSWLGAQTTFGETGHPARILTRSGWLDETGQGWRNIIEPIIDGLAAALQRGTQAEAELDPMAQMLTPMLRTSASLIYRDRLKRELGTVASDVLTGTEIGLNLLGSSDVVIIPANVARFTRDLDAPSSDVTLYLLLREAARQRLFRGVGWLSAQLNALLAHYAREITIDFDTIAAQFNTDMHELSLEEVVAVGEQVRGSFFQPASTPAQVEILERLEVLLALVEGWVDHVVAKATEQWMPNAPQLEELVHRRRGSASPVTGVFSELLGLDLRPRMVRDARNLWAMVEHQRGLSGRDAVWSHPDLLPTRAHLADPLSFTTGGNAQAPTEDAFDTELRQLLEDPDA